MPDEPTDPQISTSWITAQQDDSSWDDLADTTPGGSCSPRTWLLPLSLLEAQGQPDYAAKCLLVREGVIHVESRGPSAANLHAVFSPSEAGVDLRLEDGAGAITSRLRLTDHEWSEWIKLLLAALQRGERAPKLTPRSFATITIDLPCRLGTVEFRDGGGQSRHEEFLEQTLLSLLAAHDSSHD